MSTTLPLRSTAEPVDRTPAASPPPKITQHQTVPVSANGMFTVIAAGRYFFCVRATGTFDVRADNGDRVPSSYGTQIFFDTFARLTFYDTSGAANSIEYWNSTDPIQISPTVAQGNLTVVPTSTAAAATEGVHLFAANDTPEQLSVDPSIYFQSLWLYAAKGVSGGKLTPNTVGPIYAGRSPNYQPDSRATTDTAYPILYTLPSGQKMQLAQVRVQGKIGDGVFFSYT